MPSDARIETTANFAGLDMAAWYDQLEDVADELGHYNFLGKHHSSAFIEAGPKLLVTFEHASQIIERKGAAVPVGFQYVENQGWSHLGLYASQDSWFRDARVYSYFDRLIDDGFFENFDDVLFYGEGAGGYAAAAYSVAAPGCRVLALRPQATLDPRIAGFDPRYKANRRDDFTSRYGYAPDMIDAADKAYIAFDPHQVLDAVHAALFTKPNVTALRCSGFGNKIDRGLDAMNIAESVMLAAMDGSLDTASFAKLMRARRGYVPYLRTLTTMMLRRERPRMAANVCAHAVRAGHDKFFKDQLAELQAKGHMPFTPIKIRTAV